MQEQQQKQDRNAQSADHAHSSLADCCNLALAAQLDAGTAHLA